jgi:hypothetical protein
MFTVEFLQAVRSSPGEISSGRGAGVFCAAITGGFVPGEI